MSWTATQLVRELSSRLGTHVLSTATSLGTNTTIVDTSLLQYFPNPLTQMNAWVYGYSGTVGNVGQERRASSFTPNTNTLALYNPGFPSPTANADVFEISLRFPRARLLRAINDAATQLGLLWYREFVDESITTASNTWRYVLPATQNWAGVSKIQLQVNTDATMPTFPYGDASPWNPGVYRTVSAAGVETWYVQFGILPPPNRLLRIFGEASFPTLVADTDVLATAGGFEGAAVVWMFDYALYKLNEWEAMREPAGQTDKYMLKRQQLLETQRQKIMDMAPPHKSTPIIIPGRGTGTWDSGRINENPDYLGAFRSP